MRYNDRHTQKIRIKHQNKETRTEYEKISNKGYKKQTRFVIGKVVSPKWGIWKHLSYNERIDLIDIYVNARNISYWSSPYGMFSGIEYLEFMRSIPKDDKIIEGIIDVYESDDNAEMRERVEFRIRENSINKILFE